MDCGGCFKIVVGAVVGLGLTVLLLDHVHNSRELHKISYNCIGPAFLVLVYASAANGSYSEQDLVGSDTSSRKFLFLPVPLQQTNAN
jgi:hypothetical protein